MAVLRGKGVVVVEPLVPDTVKSTQERTNPLG